MDQSPENQENAGSHSKKHMGIAVFLVVLAFLLAASAYAFFITSEPEESPAESEEVAEEGMEESVDIDEGDDIEEGDIVDDLDPLTGVPYSGEWTFQLSVGNPGPATLSVSPTGSYVSMAADGQNIFFYNTSSIVPYTYRSNPKAFDIREPDDSITQGYAYFEFTAVNSDVIDGVLYHDTDILGVVAKSFHMELVSIELPDNEWTPLTSGDWEIDYHDGDSECEDGAVSFPDLSTDMTLDYGVDLDSDSPTGDMSMDFDGEDVSMSPGDAPNEYGQSSGTIDPGMPQNAEGDVLLDYVDDTFTSEIDVWGVGEDSMEGSITFTGSGGCSFNVGFTGTYVGS